MEPESNSRPAGREIDAEMDKSCSRVIQLVAEAELVKQDPKAILEKLKEIKSEIQKMQAINERASALKA